MTERSLKELKAAADYRMISEKEFEFKFNEFRGGHFTEKMPEKVKAFGQLWEVNLEWIDVAWGDYKYIYKPACKLGDGKINYLVINEQHKLLPEQEWLLDFNYEFETFQNVKIPAAGWTRQQMDEWIDSLDWTQVGDVVFVSPVPYLIKMVTIRLGGCSIFFNEKREKKELPDGKIIMVLAQDGWILV
jgi:hypothetical protein